MRVLYFHQHFSTREGNTGTRSYEMAKRLIERGHEVTVVCASYAHGRTGITIPFENGRRQSVVDGIVVIEFELVYSNELSFPKRIVVFGRYAFRGTMLALRAEYDLLFATSAPLTAAIPGILMKAFRFRKRPFVFEIRDPWPESPRAMGAIKNPILLGLMDLLETLAYRAADGYIALSPGMVAAFTRKRVPEQLISMIPNGSDNELIQISQTREFDLPGIDKGDFVAVYTGAHGVANGLDRLVDAAARINADGCENIKIVLIGDGAMKASLQRRVENEGLQSVVLFFDPIPKSRLQDLMTQADLGLMILDNVPVFYYGSSPNKFFDYLSYGIPVLVNHPGWVRDLIEDADCGAFADPADASDLANQICLLSQVPVAERAAMGRRGRKLAEDKFDRRLLSGQFVDALESTYDRWTTRYSAGSK